MKWDFDFVKKEPLKVSSPKIAWFSTSEEALTAQNSGFEQNNTADCEQSKINKEAVAFFEESTEFYQT